MHPEDDFLLLKPARKENVTILRIALMALMGCLILLSALVIQVRAEPDAGSHPQGRAVHHFEHPHPSAEPSGRSPAPRIRHGVQTVI